MGLKLIGLIAGIFVARYAGPNVVGTIAYGVSYVSVLLFIPEIWGTPHIKLVSGGNPLQTCMATYLRLKLSSLLAYILIMVGIILIQKYVLKHTFEDEAIEVVIWISLTSMTLFSLYNIANNTFMARQEQAKALYPRVIKEVVYQIGRIIIVILGFKAITLASWDLLITILILPLAINLFLKLPIGKWDGSLASKYVKIAIPLLSVVITANMMRYADKMFLQHFTSTTELGYYGAAFAIGGLIIEIGRSAGVVFFPMFSSYIISNDWNNVNEKNYKYQEFIVIFLFPVTCILAIIAEPFLTFLLGAKYLPSAIPFSILLFASYVSIVGIPYGNVITGMGKFNLYALITFLKFCVFLVSIFAFVSPLYLGLGATGLALSLLAINIFENLMYVVVASKIGKIRIFFKNNLRYLIIGVIAIGFFLLSPIMKKLFDMWWLFMLPAFAFVTYFTLFITRLAGKENLMMFFELMNIKKTSDYIRKELNDRK
jgi:O-antigen/teichoic acid export membrane protein